MYSPEKGLGVFWLTWRRIVAGKLSFPAGMSKEAKDLIGKLCEVNPAKRLGNLAGGARDVKAHPWFENTNWSTLYKREVQGPIIPRLSGCVSLRRPPDISVALALRKSIVPEGVPDALIP